jgi:hypothetical protein
MCGSSSDFLLLFFLIYMSRVVSVVPRVKKVVWADVSQVLTSAVPLLSFDTYKGQAARTGVIGGSIEYTGAP